jgi:Uma2 family endonuclease
MSTILPQLLTADEYWQTPGGTASSELLHGEVHRTMPPGAEHGRIVLRLGAKLLAWVEQANAGYIGTEAGYLLETNPDSVRGPDLSYVRKERIPASGIPKAFWRLAPDVAIECVSPNEAASGVREKVRDYLNAGTLLVWLIFPNTREVVVHSPDGSSQVYGEQEVLEFPEVMPGFRCTLQEVL